MDNPVIKRALYPPVGTTPSSQKGGSKPKTDFQWQVCIELFGEDLTYGPAFTKACALSGKAALAARSSWAGKIKNQLKVSVSQKKKINQTNKRLTSLSLRAWRQNLGGHGIDGGNR